MIFPWLNGIVSIYRAPLTWGIVLLNCFLFLGFLGRTDGGSDLEAKLGASGFLKVQAYYYRSYLENNPSPELDEMLSVLTKNKNTDRDNLWLAQASLRDGNFLEEMPNMKFYPDPIMQKEWEANWDEFKIHQGGFNNLAKFGISSFSRPWTSYITYQFIHSGWVHLFSNMIVLLIFGGAVEILFGPILLGLVYILGGAAGGIMYAITTGISFSPLVGASGSVSAIMGFYLIAEFRKNVPFFYFMSPMPGHNGVIYLSKWWIILAAVVNDLAAVISTPSWLMGIAYTAHLGASVFGIFVALIISLFAHEQMGARALRRAQTEYFSFQPEQNHDA